MDQPSNQIGPNVSKPATPSERSCRICFDTESSSHHLISPCRCSGSMKFVHEDCLKIWLLSQEKDLSDSICDICKSGFKMTIILETKCTCNTNSVYCCPITIFPILILLMSSIFIVILIFLTKGIKSKSFSLGEQTYMVILMVICNIIIVIIVSIFAKSVKKNFFLADIVKWSIESVTYDNIGEESCEQANNNLTLLNDDMQVMVFPKYLKVNGMNVARPQVHNPRLMPIVRSGELVGFRNKPLVTRSLAVSRQGSAESSFAHSENFLMRSLDVEQGT